MTKGAEAFERMQATARAAYREANVYTCPHCNQAIEPGTVRILRGGERYHGVCAANMRKARQA